MLAAAALGLVLMHIPVGSGLPITLAAGFALWNKTVAGNYRNCFLDDEDSVMPTVSSSSDGTANHGSPGQGHH